jgi:hypothetical protein
VKAMVTTMLKIDTQPENRRLYYGYTNRYFARAMETNTSQQFLVCKSLLMDIISSQHLALI